MDKGDGLIAIKSAGFHRPLLPGRGRMAALLRRLSAMAVLFVLVLAAPAAAAVKQSYYLDHPGGVTEYNAHGCRFNVEFVITHYISWDAPAGGSWGFWGVQNCPGLESRISYNGSYGPWRQHPSSFTSFATTVYINDPWVQIRWNDRGTWRYATVEYERYNVYTNPSSPPPAPTTTTTTRPPTTTTTPLPPCDPACCC